MAGKRRGAYLGGPRGFRHVVVGGAVREVVGVVVIPRLLTHRGKRRSALMSPGDTACVCVQVAEGKGSRKEKNQGSMAGKEGGESDLECLA